MAKFKTFKYNRIICFMSWGTWQADYITEAGDRFPLHRRCLPTKAMAYALAKQEVDALNEEVKT